MRSQFDFSADGPSGQDCNLSAVTDDESPRRIRRGLRWVFLRHLPFGGLVGALILFSISLTPWTWITQPPTRNLPSASRLRRF